MVDVPQSRSAVDPEDYSVIDERGAEIGRMMGPRRHSGRLGLAASRARKTACMRFAGRDCRNLSKV